MNYRIDDLKGKKIQLYPHDTDFRRGEILDLNEKGILLKITASNDKMYPVNTIAFFNWQGLKFNLEST